MAVAAQRSCVSQQSPAQKSTHIICSLQSLTGRLAATGSSRIPQWAMLDSMLTELDSVGLTDELDLHVAGRSSVGNHDLLLFCFH